MNGLARKRVTLNLKVNVQRSGISILRILLLWFLVSINNMKKTPIAIDLLFPIVRYHAN